MKTLGHQNQRPCRVLLWLQTNKDDDALITKEVRVGRRKCEDTCEVYLFQPISMGSLKVSSSSTQMPPDVEHGLLSMLHMTN